MTAAKPKPRVSPRPATRSRGARTASVSRSEATPLQALKVHPATAARWSDLEELFGRRGACAGCWCMWWRRRGAAWEEQRGAKNRLALRGLVAGRGPAPGLIAYAAREPVGWIALAPRTDYVRLAHSRVLAPIDDHPVWSITCLFVRPDWRGRGVTAALLDGAIALAEKHGAREIEAYPIDTHGKRAASVWLYTGTPSMFARAGFVEVARRSAPRPIMRRSVG